jgi:hypothetical protein
MADAAGERTGGLDAARVGGGFEGSATPGFAMATIGAAAGDLSAIDDVSGGAAARCNSCTRAINAAGSGTVIVSNSTALPSMTSGHCASIRAS